MPDLSLILIFVGAIVAGAITALKVIAPLTETKVDDRALETLEKLPKLPN